MSGKKTASLLVIALVLGVAGAGLSILYLKAREADLIDALKPKSQPIPVVVASRDLVKGDKLTTNTLSVREIPSDYVDPNAIKPEEFDSIDGLVLTQNLASGKPLLRSFIDREFPLDFSDTIPLKRRAMTIQVDETNTIAGLLRPGNRIDLFVNLPASEASEEGSGNEIMPVVENVEVLATGRDAARDYEEKVRLLRFGMQAQPNQNFTTITLNVTPRQAALIAMAQDKGDMMALLRNRNDDSASGFVKVSTDTIAENASELARQAAEKARLQPVGSLTTNANGDVVDENGNIITGVKLNEDGTVTLPDGRRVKPEDLVVNPDGSMSIRAGAEVINPDGSITESTGETIDDVSAVKSLGKLTTNANGELVDENGNVISGLQLNEDGTVTLPDGRRVDPNEIVVGADGQLRLKNGEKIEGVTAVKPVGELKTDENGNVVDANGNVLAGVTLNEDGTVTLPDGRRVKAEDLIVNPDGSMSIRAGAEVTNPDGTVTRSDGETIDGVQMISAEEAAAFNFEIDYIVGGVSQDSVATVNKLTIEQDTETETQE